MHFVQWLLWILLKLIIDNYPEGKTEMLTGENNPEQENTGSRDLPFSRELWIEHEDFKEVAEKKYFRLAPGLMVRLKSAYIIKCESFEKDAFRKYYRNPLYLFSRK